MNAVERIPARQARDDFEAGRALLVCAYDSDEKFRQFFLGGALSLGEFRAQEGAIPKDQEIIFYCA